MNPRIFPVLCASLFVAQFASAQNSQSADKARLVRQPWTASNIKGSPEPPRPYVAERVFPNLKIRDGLEMVALEGRLLVMTRQGKIWSFVEDAAQPKLDLFADLKAINPKLNSAYGLVFHPDWRQNGQVFAAYTIGSGIEDGTRLCRYRFEIRGGKPRMDPDSEELILTWLSGGHNGANLQFGPDGMLYVSTGDASPPNPPDGLKTGQDNSDLLACVLRIDVDNRDGDLAYRVPPDNPFVGKANVRPEIWAFGFRNPWKMSFDSRGRLWLGDVGWELWEMIHLVEKGGNYGWSAMEADNPILPETASALAPIAPPVAAHPHTEAASMTGGYEYRGSRLPKLRGAYVYGDYETGKIWALRHEKGNVVEHTEIADTPHRISTFGVGASGALYYIHYAGESEIYRLKPNPRAGQPPSFPRRLSQTGLFSDTAQQTPEAGVYPFAVQEPMWQDGADAVRYVALPGRSGIQTDIQHQRNGSRRINTTWPDDAALAKTISIAGNPVETQVLHHDGETWNGYSYRWNESGTDADLVPAEGVEFGINGRGWRGGDRYRISSRAECLRCHSMWNKFTPAFEPMQLAGFGGFTNQPAREVAVALNLANADFFNQNLSGHLQNSRRGGSLDKRARSWLHANCAHCHRRHGGGTAPLEVNFERALTESFTLWQQPSRGEFGLAEPGVIVPGHPERSVLLYRVSAIGAGHMPPIGPREVDAQGVRLLWQWIAGMPAQDSPQAPDIKRFENHWLGAASSAMRLAHAVAEDELNETNRNKALTAALESPNFNVRALFERFRPPSQRPQTQASDPTRILALRGDAKAGAGLLNPTGKLAACLACHPLNQTGRDLGPDLTTVGSRLTREQLLESLVAPSKTIAPEYRVWNVETKDGELQTGFIAQRTDAALHLKLATGQSAVISNKEIVSSKPQTLSLMPAGLLGMMTEQEAADLLAFLKSLTP